MKLNYKLDISPESTCFVNTPTATSKRLPFYLNECGHYIAGNEYFTERQGQYNYLLIYTLSGSGWLKYNNQEYVLGPGQAVVIHCNRYHFYRTLSPKSWNFKWIHFDGTAAKDYYLILNEDSLSVIQLNNPVEFEKMMDALNLYFNVNDILTSVKAATQITNIFSLLIINKFSPMNIKKYTEHQQEVIKVINYIQANYGQQITLDDLTKIAYISKYYFLRVFQKHTGASPYEYLINYRINKAKEFLKNSDLSVGEVGETVGFNDYNNFIRKFKEITGITPLHYKKYSNI